MPLQLFWSIIIIIITIIIHLLLAQVLVSVNVYNLRYAANSTIEATDL